MKTAKSGPPQVKKSRGRSRVTNGSSLFVVADGRSVWARRFSDIFAAHVSDLGGAAVLSEAELSLCKRAAGLAVECERIEGALADGHEADIDLLGRLIGHLGRTLERIGLKRVAKDIDHNPLLDHFSRPPERRSVA